MTIDELRRIDLFDGIDDAELDHWRAAAEEQTFKEGERVIEQGVAPLGLYLLLEGSLESMFVVDGRTEHIGHQNSPTWIGAIAALTDQELGLTMAAETDVRLALIPRERFVDLARENGVVHQRIMSKVAPITTRLTTIQANRERLASLGTMAAGLAHELNNPAAAAKRAASSLVEALQITNYALRAFVEAGIEREDAAKLLELQKEAIERAEEREALDPVAQSDAEDAMLELLEDMEIREPWRLAEPLSYLDADWLSRVHAIAGPVTGKALHWVAASVTAKSLAEELLDSTSRMSTLVGAVKTYAYMDRGGLITADIHEGLESTIVMMGHKLKHRKIRIVREYDKTLPKLTMHGSELNQVWTNLIHNAIQALGETGTITIRTSRDGDCAKVDVGDDGPGIPDTNKDRVFDPFFTTKEVGAGTGLGLDTCRRIVEERHRGSISFDTGPDGTVFHVWLPFEDTAR
jgi:signal transduction histidine kinase